MDTTFYYPNESFALSCFVFPSVVSLVCQRLGPSQIGFSLIFLTPISNLKPHLKAALKFLNCLDAASVFVFYLFSCADSRKWHEGRLMITSFVLTC